MAKEPERRYRSASALARALRVWLEEHAGTTEIDPPPPAPTPFRWGRWALAAGALAVAAGMLGAFAWLVAEPHPAALATTEATTGATTPQASPGTAMTAADAAAAAREAGGTASRSAAAGEISSQAMTALGNAGPEAAPTPTSPATGASPATAATPVSAAATGTAPPPATAWAPPPTFAAPPTLSLGVGTPPAAESHEVRKPAPPTESAAARRTREAREREAKVAAAAAALVVAAPTVTGVVRIAVSPWGRVEVDGNAAGVAPPLNQLTLPEGRHRITVTNEDFPPYSATVDVTGGQPVTVKHHFGS